MTNKAITQDEFPPFHRVQVPLVDADLDMSDIKRLATWCEREAKKYAVNVAQLIRERQAESIQPIEPQIASPIFVKGKGQVT